MRVKTIIDEVYNDYKKPSMLIATPKCGGKCWRELNLDESICQNEQIKSQPTINLTNSNIINRYISNKLTNAVILAGLEPFEDFEDLIGFIREFRNTSSDDVIIFTGYYESEIKDEVNELKLFSEDNIIIKYGRYIPNAKPRYSEVLGVNLASENQYAKVL